MTKCLVCREGIKRVEIEPVIEPDLVTSPSHYTVGGIEAIEVLRAKMSAEKLEGFFHGNALKYLLRADHKGRKLEDLKKARKNLDWLIEQVESQSSDIQPPAGS